MTWVSSCTLGQDNIDDASVYHSNGRCSLHSYENRPKQRRKANDPTYQRAREGKGVYGVQLFDFSRDPEALSALHNDILWGGGYWVPEQEARIDPDVIQEKPHSIGSTYSTTHFVAIFVLGVRCNKTPWPKKNKQYLCPVQHHHDPKINRNAIKLIQQSTIFSAHTNNHGSRPHSPMPTPQ